MNFYSEMQNIARDIFGEFQQGAIAFVPIVRTGGTPDEPGTVSDGTPVTLTATAKPVSTKYVDGTHIVRSDIEIAMPAGVVDPSIEGYFTIDGVRYKVIEVMRRPAAGTAVAYTVVVRR